MTTPQQTALQLAAREPLRYYRGGWHSIPAVGGDDQQRARTAFAGPSVTAVTLRACVTRGWLSWQSEGGIYAQRWTLTDEGREAIK